MEAISIVLSVLGAIGGVLWLAERWQEFARNRLFFRVFPRTVEILIVTPTLPGVISAPNDPTTLEDAFALATVQSTFARQRIRFRVKPHHAVTAGDRAGWLFLIGGPSTNSVATRFYESVRLPITFNRVEPHHHVIVAEDGEEHRYEGPQDPDYAILGVFSNPWSEEARVRVYVCSGLEGVGTWAAASALVERPRELEHALRAQRLDVRRGFECLIAARVDDRYTPIVKFCRVVAAN